MSHIAVQWLNTIKVIDVSLQDGSPDVKKKRIEETERVEIINTNTQNGFKLGSNGISVGSNGVHHVITGQRVTTPGQPQTLRPKGQLPISKSINSKIITIQQQSSGAWVFPSQPIKENAQK